MNKYYLLLLLFQVLVHLLHAVGKVVLRKFIRVIYISLMILMYVGLRSVSAVRTSPALIFILGVVWRSTIFLVARFLVLRMNALIVPAESEVAAESPAAAYKPLLT